MAATLVGVPHNAAGGCGETGQLHRTFCPRALTFQAAEEAAARRPVAVPLACCCVTLTCNPAHYNQHNVPSTNTWSSLQTHHRLLFPSCRPTADREQATFSAGASPSQPAHWQSFLICTHANWEGIPLAENLSRDNSVAGRTFLVCVCGCSPRLLSTPAAPL